MKDETIQIRITKAEKESLVEAAERLEVPASQIVRKAVKKEVAELNKKIEEEAETALAK